MLVQVLPKAARDESLVETLESRIASLSGFTPLLQAGQVAASDFCRSRWAILGLQMLPETQLRAVSV